MTVDELIEKLAAYPGDWEVVYDDDTLGPIEPDMVAAGKFKKRLCTRSEFVYRVDGKYMECNSVMIR